MKRALLLAISLTLVLAGLSLPAQAKKKKQQRRPVPVVLYLHGNEAIGEIETINSLSGGGGYMFMDTTEGTGEKSMQFLNYIGGPNSDCAGNNLFPVWLGDVAGTIVGDIKVTFPTIATPGDVTVRLWKDQVAQACNSNLGMDYVLPDREANVTIGAGPATNEAILPGVNFSPTVKLMLQINAVIAGTVQGRIMYDVSDAKVEFMCIPPAGKTTCTP